MNEQYELLGTLDEVWAKMLMEILRGNGIPSTSMPVYGYALTAKSGVTESSRIFVPAACLERARELREEMFSGNGEEALEELFCEEENGN